MISSGSSLSSLARTTNLALLPITCRGTFVRQYASTAPFLAHRPSSTRTAGLAAWTSSWRPANPDLDARQGVVRIVARTQVEVLAARVAMVDAIRVHVRVLLQCFVARCARLNGPSSSCGGATGIPEAHRRLKRRARDPQRTEGVGRVGGGRSAGDPPRGTECGGPDTATLILR